MSFYIQMKEKMNRLIKEHHLDNNEITITTSTMSPEEAIGITERKDFPLLKGKEVLLKASFKGCVGQAFTDHPSIFKGSINELLSLNLDKNNNRALFIASINAILKYLGLIEKTVHCKNEDPEKCAWEITNHLKDKYGNVKIGLIGLQPAILDNLAKNFTVRVLDLNTDNIGKEKYGVLIEDGEKSLDDILKWADIILATGSTIANGTILNFLNLDKPVFFYGTTIAGAAYLLGLKRLCFCAS